MTEKYEVKVTRQALEQMQEIRKAVVKNFLSYFWVDDENRKVQVIAVIYAKREQLEQLKKSNITDNESTNQKKIGAFFNMKKEASTPRMTGYSQVVQNSLLS